MEKKHAYLIIAHNHWWQLIKLMQLLDDERNDIFLHIDGKSRDADLSRLSTVCQKSKVHIYQEVSVHWGGYSQIRCEMLLFEKAYAGGSYAFFHLISGSDLPLKTQNEIHSYFAQHPGESFLGFDDALAEKVAADRAKYYSFFQEWRGGKFHLLSRLLNGLSLRLQMLLEVDRLAGQEKIYFGPNWVSLPPESVRILLDRKTEIAHRFRHSFCCDEIYKQTILRNAGVSIHCLGGSVQESVKRYIVFENNNASPNTFTVKNEGELLESTAFFARKFDETLDREIITRTFQRLWTAQNPGEDQCLPSWPGTSADRD